MSPHSQPVGRIRGQQMVSDTQVSPDESRGTGKQSLPIRSPKNQELREGLLVEGVKRWDGWLCSEQEWIQKASFLSRCQREAQQG